MEGKDFFFLASGRTWSILGYASYLEMLSIILVVVFFAGAWLVLGVKKTSSSPPLFSYVHDGKMITWSAWKQSEPNGEDEKCAYVYVTETVCMPLSCV